MRMNHRSALLMLALASAPSAACEVMATAFQFGVVDPLVPAETESTSTISVTCPAATNYSIALSAGAGTFSERRMQSGTNALIYNLYTDAAHTAIWGDGTGVSVVVNGMADTTGTTHTVYGRLPHQPTAVPGAYADSIIVTLSF